MRHSSHARKLGFDETAHRLRDAFVRTTTPPDALRAEKQTPGQNFKELIQCLSREIDETVLPRKLALYSGDDIVATMIVSNRRLVELEIGGEKVEVQSDGDADPETVARAYAQALKSISARSGSLLLRPIGRAPQTAMNSAACTAQHLSVFGEASAFENRMQLLLKQIHTHSFGWIFRPGEGEAVAHDPKADIFERLKTLDQNVMAQAKNNGRFSRVDKSRPFCSAFALTDNVQALIATDGSDRLVAAVPQADLCSAMDHWHQVFGRPQDHV